MPRLDHLRADQRVELERLRDHVARRAHAVLGEEAEDAPDAGFGPVLGGSKLVLTAMGARQERVGKGSMGSSLEDMNGAREAGNDDRITALWVKGYVKAKGEMMSRPALTPLTPPGPSSPPRSLSSGSGAAGNRPHLVQGLDVDVSRPFQRLARRPQVTPDELGTRVALEDGAFGTFLCRESVHGANGCGPPSSPESPRGVLHLNM